MNKVLLPGVALCALAMAAPAAAQVDLGIDYTFDVLKFAFQPEGPEASGDSGGSSLEIHADRVQILHDYAVDLRHCIDDQEDCSYHSALQAVGYHANADGQVEPAEVDLFAGIAPLGVAREPKIVALNDLLQHNLTVDGQEGGRPRVAKVTFDNAPGPITNDAPVYAYLTIVVSYENDKKQKSHALEIKDFDLKSQGYAYGNAAWVAEAPHTWSWNAKKAEPESARAFLKADGWFSTQAEFEAQSASTLHLVAEKGGGKKTPGLEVGFLIAAASLVVAGLRRSA